MTHTANTGKPLSALIAEEEARLQAVESARRARLEQDYHEQAEIEQSKQRLATLQRQQAQERFNDLLKQNASALQDNNAAMQDLHKALNTVQEAFKACFPQFAAVEQSFEQQQVIHDRALNAARGLVQPVEATDEGRMMHAAIQEANQLRGYEGQITPAWPLPTAVLKWVLQAQGDDEIRIRLGIAYAVTGGALFSFDPKNRPTDEQLHSQLKLQITRLRRV